MLQSDSHLGVSCVLQSIAIQQGNTVYVSVRSMRDVLKNWFGSQYDGWRVRMVFVSIASLPLCVSVRTNNFRHAPKHI